MTLTPELVKELQTDMSLDRLAKTGLFIKLDLEDCDHIRRELTLHRAVLDRALIDSFYPDKAFYWEDTKKTKKVFIKEEVTKWLKIDNPDFIEACERADLEPALVFEIFKQMHNILTGDKAKFRRRINNKNVERN